VIFLSLSFVGLECSFHFLSFRARSMLINLFLSVKLEFPFLTILSHEVRAYYQEMLGKASGVHGIRLCYLGSGLITKKCSGKGKKSGSDLDSKA
jgi:hypothetical protein